MKKKLLPLMAGLFFAAAFPATAAETAALDWSQHKYGLYVHFGIFAFAKPGEKAEIPAERFAPGSLDVSAWVRTAKEAGMTFVVIVVKHESGFCLWPSKDYGYDVSQSAYKGDIIRDFIAACKTEGIVPGVHYSIPDHHNEGTVRFRGPVAPPYFAVIKKHMTELHTSYPELRVQIFDVSQRLSPVQLVELQQLIRRLNPNCAVWNTTGGDAGPYHASATVIKTWGWSPNSPLIPAEILFPKYQSVLAAHKALVLNVGPDRTGKIPANQVEVLTRLKQMIDQAPPPAASSANGIAPAKAPVGERLKHLKELYEKGLISKEDYDKKLQEIMDSL